MMKFLAFVSVAATAVFGGVIEPNQLPGYTFEQFLKDFGKVYPSKSEYSLRKTLFEERKASMVKHNSQGHSYFLNVNKFADMSQDEIQKFKGYNKFNGRVFRTFVNLSDTSQDVPVSDLPASLDWRTKGAITPVKDQGGCGSCWAFGSAENLESHTFLYGKDKKLLKLSEQQLVDCAPNPNHCGGTGGCEGSIPELAYDYVKAHGLALETDYPYRGYDGQCKKVTAAASVTGYVNVLSNNYTSVMNALQKGPLAITVAAMPWQLYGGGVFTDCSSDTTDLDHVVQLVGYGEDQQSGKLYWLVRNSWSSGWGEDGYIRLERHTSAFCGTDRKPADGTGCDGGPSTVEVCGSCGILYDAVYPTV